MIISVCVCVCVCDVCVCVTCVCVCVCDVCVCVTCVCVCVLCSLCVWGYVYKISVHSLIILLGVAANNHCDVQCHVYSSVPLGHLCVYIDLLILNLDWGQVLFRQLCPDI